ncbi:MAG TPA: class II aldolase/adducin family protein [Actinoplanes sp.]|jgi:ribulose-5-phosphate 4-epimerase/fuculose-1-phosphate aldolase|nr:class II aldolase/adducin family protein [Actinoplanes sp.]
MRVTAQDSDTAAQGAEIAGAARVLAALDLVTAFGHVSARAGDHLLITPATPLADVRDTDLIRVPLDAVALPPGAPGESWLHLSIYGRRPDVGAIARAQPPAAFPVAAVTTALLPLHGQACWLGRSIPVHDDARLLRARPLADAAAATLGKGAALLLRGNGAATTAPSPGLAVARMWLLSAACQAWLSAAASGPVRALTDAEIDAWQAVEGDLLPRLWRHLRREVTAD